MSTKVNKKTDSDRCVVFLKTHISVPVLIDGRRFSLCANDKVVIRCKDSGLPVIDIEIF